MWVSISAAQQYSNGILPVLEEKVQWKLGASFVLSFCIFELIITEKYKSNIHAKLEKLCIISPINHLL